MKILYSLLSLIMIMCNSTQSIDEKTFDLNKAKINKISLDKISKKDIILKFGKPMKISLEVNEFTGEKYYVYYYASINFEISENNKVFPSDILDKEITIDYKGVLIHIGDDITELQTEFPQYNFNLNEGQVNILIKNTTASYIEFYIVNKKIKGISFTENY